MFTRLASKRFAQAGRRLSTAGYQPHFENKHFPIQAGVMLVVAFGVYSTMLQHTKTSPFAGILSSYHTKDGVWVKIDNQ